MIHPDKNTLVILTPGFAASEQDSACLPMHQRFVKTLKKEYPQFKIIVFAFHYPFEKKYYRLYDAEIYSFGGRNKRGIASWIMRRNVYRKLKKIHASNKLVGILSFWYGECAIVGKKFADANNLPHYCWILGQDARNTNKFPKRLKPEAGELVALSDFLQQEFLNNHGVKPAYVIPPGMDRMNNSKTREIDILGVGSLIPLKQFEILIELVSELKEAFPFLKATIIGEGSEKNKWQELIREKNIETVIELKGSLSYSQTLEIMQRSRILLHPSAYEGFSGVCMEALATGMNVISFCRPMNTEFPQWHIVDDKESMKARVVELLSTANTPYQSIQLFKMEESVRAMMGLFKTDF